LVEFTGERVVPDQVSADLWSEHLARYAFARRYAAGKRVLDCGCGTGYGSVELAETASEVTGVYISADAIDYALGNYTRNNTRYLIGSCLDLAFPAESFDVVVAFEVIEHLSGFRRCIDECARVLTPSGLFIVSTPNKNYYAESRAQSGPNPFHIHEFEPGEFRTELTRAFPNVALLVQNRVESFAFSGDALAPSDARIDGGSGSPDEAHFFIALCSKAALPGTRSFIYVPRAANLLREREQHIHLLQDQLRSTQSWLAETQQERDRLLRQYRDQLTAYDRQKDELEAGNRWAEKLGTELAAAYERVGQLQLELTAEQQNATEMAAAYDAKVRELETENLAKTQWALDTDQRLTAEIDRIAHELAECVRLLGPAEETVVERTLWAQRLEKEKQALESQLNAVRISRWVKAGRMVGLGPDLP